jgi:signal transduction histidine kinase
LAVTQPEPEKLGVNLLCAKPQREAPMPEYERVIDLLLQMTETQQKQFDDLRATVDDLRTIVVEQTAMRSRRSAESLIITKTLIGLGNFLISTKVIPPDTADALVSVILEGTDYETQEKARTVVEMLKAWASSSQRKDRS